MINLSSYTVVLPAILEGWSFYWQGMVKLDQFAVNVIFSFFLWCKLVGRLNIFLYVVINWGLVTDYWDFSFCVLYMDKSITELFWSLNPSSFYRRGICCFMFPF